MNIFIIGLFIVGLFLFAVGLLDAFTNRSGVLLISASILLASVIICVKLEELKKN
jgi:hypothetical protein